MKRISIIGASGSGKTVLGATLARRLNCESIDLDELNWQPGWKEVPQRDFSRSLGAALKAPQWVISGNYSRVQDKYLEAADTLIWLDYPFPTVLWRLSKRTYRRVLYKEPCCNGNFETIGRTVSKDSVVLWLFRTYRARRASSERLFDRERHPHLEKLRFKSPRETQKWLDSL